MLNLYLKVFNLILNNIDTFGSYWFSNYFLHDKFRNELLSSNLHVHYATVSHNTSKSGMMTR